MSDERPSEVLAGLPHTRPHRRSQKRAAPPTGAPAATLDAAAAPSASTWQKQPERSSRRAPARRSAPGATKRATPSGTRVRQPAQPPGTPSSATLRNPLPVTRLGFVGSAVHVSAEIAEIGISASARAVRGVVARLPKP